MRSRENLLNERLSVLVRHFWPHLLLTATVICLFIANYKPGTWLAGWDNLIPELDFRTNIIERSLYSTWQEYQGLGVAAGNAHAADLLHQLGMLAASVFLPLPILRYVYHFLALIVGAIGIYELLSRTILRRSESRTRQTAAFAGALFAILNPGTMQYFAVPYEAFSHFFAALPWLILSLTAYLANPSRKNLLILGVAHLLAIPAFYIPTIFVIYAMILSGVFAWALLRRRNVSRVILAAAVIVAVNAYWLLPFTGFIAGGTAFVSEIKINRIFTDEAYLRSEKFGSVSDLAMLKGFLFDTTDLMDNRGTHDYMMAPWIRFLNQPAVHAGYLVLFAAAAGSIVYAAVKRSPYALLSGFLFAFGAFFLLTDNPPTGVLFGFLRSHVGVFRQIFRFPYTKIIPVFIIGYAMGVAYAVRYLWQLAGGSRRRLVRTFAVPAVALLMVLSSLPSLTGNFIYDKMRVSIPVEYFHLFEFFRSQNDRGRIANLPQPTFWGWVTYDWGYRGSGFPWYGIRQPILDRAFDVWNTYNETYYRDLTDALYFKQSVPAVRGVLDKYRVAYVWVDKRVIMPYKPELLYTDVTSLLDSDPSFNLVFRDGQQFVYRYEPVATAGDVSLYDTPPLLSMTPFTDPKRLTIHRDADGLTVSVSVPAGQLRLPPLAASDETFLARPQRTADGFTFTTLSPDLTVDSKNLPGTPKQTTTVNIPKDFLQTLAFTVNSHMFNDTGTSWITLHHKNNYLAGYAASYARPSSLKPELFAVPVRNCETWNASFATKFSGIILPDGMLEMNGTQSDPCIYERIDRLATTKPETPIDPYGLLSVGITYRSNTADRPQVCLTREGEQACYFKTDVPVTSGSVNGWTTAYYQMPMNGLPLSAIWFKIELNASGKTENHQLLLSDVTLQPFGTYAYVQRFDTTDDASGRSIEIPAGTLTVAFPAQERFPSYTVNPALTDHAARNCFDLARGTYERVNDREKNGDPYTRYTAHDASSCDSFVFPDQIIQPGSLVLLHTRNLSGRPLKVCVALDPLGQCLYEDIVPVSGHSWTDTPFFTPYVSPRVSTTYTLTVDDYAVGNETRTNDLGTISVNTFPVTWLGSIRLETAHGSLDTTGLTPVSKGVRTVRNSPVSRTVSADASWDTRGRVLTLYQSFHRGWQAYMPRTALERAFPYLLAPRLTNHFTVNGWANGWELPAGTTGGTVVIYFLPQLLEWLGFSLLPLPFIILILIRKPQRSSGRRRHSPATAFPDFSSAGGRFDHSDFSP